VQLIFVELCSGQSILFCVLVSALLKKIIPIKATVKQAILFEHVSFFVPDMHTKHSRGIVFAKFSAGIIPILLAF
jgi:hypothetical protein